MICNAIQTSAPGGDTPLYKVYRYVPPQRVWFLSPFGLKMGIDFEHFGLKLGMFFLFFFPATGRVTGESEREIDMIYHSS